MELHLERRIGKTVSEGKQRLDAKAVEVSVAYIDSFPVFFLFQISIEITEGIRTGIVLIPLCPSRCQFSLRHCLSEEDIGDRGSAFLSRLRDVQNSTDIVRFPENIRKLHRSSGIQD